MTTIYDVYPTPHDARIALIECPLILAGTHSKDIVGLDFRYDLDTIAEHSLYRVDGGWTADWGAVKREAAMHKYHYTGKYSFLPVEGYEIFSTLEVVEVVVEVTTSADSSPNFLSWGRVTISKNTPYRCKAVSGMLDGMEWSSELDLLVYVKRLVMALSDN